MSSSRRSKLRAPVVLVAAVLSVLVLAVTTAAEPLGDQFRISTRGPEGTADVDSFDPATAYNSQSNQTLVVWEADDVGDADNSYQIWGQFIDASGAPVGEDFRISTLPDPNNGRDEDVAVAYNSTRNEFLVAWERDDPGTEARDILAQRLTAAGAPIGEVTTIASGQSGDEFITYGDVKLAFNSRDDAYLAAFERQSDNSRAAVRRITGDGQATGDEIVVSDQAGFVNDPDVAYDSADNQFLVVWEGQVDRGEAGLDQEIQGQRLAADGSQIGGDFQISNVGPEDDTSFIAADAAVAYNATMGEYFVVFEAPQEVFEGDPKYEIFGQRLVGATGAEPAPEFRISDTQRPADEDFPDSLYDAADPDLAPNDGGNEYLVVWEADLSRPSADSGDEEEEEVFGQRISGAGADIGGMFRISDMLPEAGVDGDGEDAVAAYNSRSCEYVSAWEGTQSVEGTGETADDEEEIFGRRVAGAACPDLAITKEDAPDPVGVGQNITYTLVVSNNGPTSASGVVVRDELPAGVTFVSASSSQGTCTGTAAVECALGALGSAGSAQVTIVVRADSAGTIANTASVALDQVDRDAANNQATTQTTVTQEQQAPQSDLRLTVAESQDPVDLGETLTYRVTVTNGGPAAASGITLTDTIPGSARFVSARAGGASARAADGAQAAQAGSCTGRSTVRCSLGSLAPGASATARIRVRPRRVGRIRNTASVTGQQADQNAANNRVVTRTRVVDRTGPRSRVAGCAARGAIRIVARDVSGVRRLSASFRGSRLGSARGASLTVRLPALELSARQRRVSVVATDGRGNRSRRVLQFPRCRPRFTG